MKKPTRSRWAPLLEWRSRFGKKRPRGRNHVPFYGSIELADMLTVERTPDAIVPKRLYTMLVAFRHLGQPARRSAIRTWEAWMLR